LDGDNNNQEELNLDIGLIEETFPDQNKFISSTKNNNNNNLNRLCRSPNSPFNYYRMNQKNMTPR
jgi:hypothetical protein